MPLGGLFLKKLPSRWLLLARSLLPIAVFSGFIYLAISHLEAAPSAALIAVLLLSLGSALSIILQGLLAGLYLQIERPIVPGDRITVLGSTGIVQPLEARLTRLRCDDGSIAIIPNSTLIAQVILTNLPH